MARFKAVDVKLDSAQEREAERIYQQIRQAFDKEARRLSKLMASKADNELFGQTEFELRDRVHALGAEVLEATAKERVKKRVHPGFLWVTTIQAPLAGVNRRGATRAGKGALESTNRSRSDSLLLRFQLSSSRRTGQRRREPGP